jgi:predicted Mrr-cat superfamily restriction endonuclease
MTVWRIITHHLHPEQMLRWSLTRGSLAVGWGLMGDLRLSKPRSASAIATLIRNAYPAATNAGSGGPSLWNFSVVMQVDDLVILSTGKRRSAVMRVKGDYDYTTQISGQSPGDYYRHQRDAEQVDMDPDALWKEHGARPALGENIHWTVLKCG